MKVSVILTAASFFFAGLAVAAPLVASSACEVVRTDENGEEEVDIRYFVSSIKAINERHRTGNGWTKLDTDEIEFVDLLMQQIHKHGLVEELVYKLFASSILLDRFERSVDSSESSGVSEAVLADSQKVGGTVGDSLQPVVDGSEVSSDSKQFDEEVLFEDHRLSEMDKRYYRAGYLSPRSGFGAPAVVAGSAGGSEAFDWIVKNVKDAAGVIGSAYQRALENGILPAKPGSWHLCYRTGCGAVKSQSSDLSDKSSPESSDESIPVSNDRLSASSSESSIVTKTIALSSASSAIPDDGLESMISLVLSFIDF